MVVMKNLLHFIVGITLIGFISSCSHEQSTSTGWSYNDPSNGGFDKTPYVEQETGPGLVFIEGGAFTMGQVYDDVMFDWSNVARKVTVSSFYMDETEVTNLHWLEYLYWTKRVYGLDYPEIYTKALPDTLVWRQKLAFNEPYTEFYLRHPAYRDYPVVGVNWLQANDYCAWRSDRVNEYLLIREGLFEWFPNQVNEDHFSTDAYLAGQYESGKKEDGVTDLDPNSETRNVRIEDGLLLPRYSLPSEAEWEYAAYAIIGNTYEELIAGQKVYPWNGNYLRNDNYKNTFYGDLAANFVRGRGDYMGVAGHLNDGADITANVYDYWPNDFGLYNMAGNVSEWVMDVYRATNFEDVEEFRPYRGNVFKTKVLNPDGSVADKADGIDYDVMGIKDYISKFERTMQGRSTPEESSLISNVSTAVEDAEQMLNNDKAADANQKIAETVEMIKNTELTISAMLLKGISDNITETPGNMRMRSVTIEENIDRRNYRESDNINYLDGDQASSINYEILEDEDQRPMYDWGNTTLVSDRARVYKGGAWNDRAYYIQPAARRFLDERESTATIGFRCAMIRLGSPKGLGGGKR
jgi:gliding motility-associated lipoprotein GldJ